MLKPYRARVIESSPSPPLTWRIETPENVAVAVALPVVIVIS